MVVVLSLGLNLEVRCLSAYGFVNIWYSPTAIWGNSKYGRFCGYRLLGWFARPEHVLTYAGCPVVVPKGCLFQTERSVFVVRVCVWCVGGVRDGVSMSCLDHKDVSDGQDPLIMEGPELVRF